MSSSFSGLSRNRIGRRALLRTSALTGAGLAGAALIGCGGKQTPTPAAGGSGSASATAASAGTPRRGGILKFATNDSADSLDSNTAASFKANVPNAYALSRLFKFIPGEGGKPATGDIEGDVVAKWEQPDPQTIVLQIRKGMKFDQRAPTNGRELTAKDVIASLDVFAEKSAYRTDLINKANKDAAVTKWEAVDASTVKLSLAFPDASVLPSLAWTQDFWVQPAEAYNGGFNAERDMRGSGPFIMEEFKPNVSYKFKRNPDWYGGPDRPYVDGVELAIVPDVAQVEAQLKAGNLMLGATLVSPSNIPSLFKSMKDMRVNTAVPSVTGVWSMNHGSTDLWKDVRVRRAVSMAINRDALADVVYSPSKLKDVGVNARTYWNTPLGPNLGKSWLDPKAKEFGDSAKYYQHNIAEAKKMLEAAGFTAQKPLAFELCVTPQYWPDDWETRSQAIQGMLKDAGIQLSIFNTPYTADWVPNYLRAKAGFKGHRMLPAVAQFTGASKASAGQTMGVYYTSFGGNTTVGTHFPELEKMVTDERKLLKVEDRIAKQYDIQRWMAENMPVIPAAANIDLVDLSQKRLHGPELYQVYPNGWTGAGGPTEAISRWWLDA